MRALRTAASSAAATTRAHAAARGHPPQFDLKLIRRLKPFAPWLAGEMRSNHAGETGAVKIYEGALKALAGRKALKLGRVSGIEADLHAFCLEHKASEQEHLDLLDATLDGPPETSRLLPAWHVAGFLLGFGPTLVCPRAMYLTTEAVESFVEEHYNSQIRRLQIEATAAEVTAESNEEYGENVRSVTELIRMLEHCCEDEVHHKKEAADRAAALPRPWFPWVDKVWQSMVGVGSAAAATLAKRV